MCTTFFFFYFTIAGRVTISGYPGYAAGEAEYVNDQEPLSDELHGAFVLSTVGRAKLKAVDASAALVSGLVAFLRYLWHRTRRMERRQKELDLCCYKIMHMRACVAIHYVYV